MSRARSSARVVISSKARRRISPRSRGARARPVRLGRHRGVEGRRAVVDGAVGDLGQHLARGGVVDGHRPPAARRAPVPADEQLGPDTGQHSLLAVGPGTPVDGAGEGARRGRRPARRLGAARCRGDPPAPRSYRDVRSRQTDLLSPRRPLPAPMPDATTDPIRMRREGRLRMQKMLPCGSVMGATRFPPTPGAVAAGPTHDRSPAKRRRCAPPRPAWVDVDVTLVPARRLLGHALEESTRRAWGCSRATRSGKGRGRRRAGSRAPSRRRRIAAGSTLSRTTETPTTSAASHARRARSPKFSDDENDRRHEHRPVRR